MEPLPIEVASLDTIPEGARGAYVKDGDKFVLPFDFGAAAKARGYKTPEEISGLQSALEKERGRARDLEGKAKLTEAEVAELATLRDAEKKRKGEEMVPAAKLDEMFAERTKGMQTKHQQELEERQKQIAERDSTLDRVIVDDAFRAASSGLEGFRATAQDDLLLYVRVVGWRRDKDNNPVLVYRDPATGEERTRFGAEGQPMRPQEWLQSLRESKPHWFDDPEGGGGRHKAGGDRNGFPAKRSEFTMAQKLDFIDKNGEEGYLALPA